jgi:hypothetical protein
MRAEQDKEDEVLKKKNETDRMEFYTLSLQNF